MVKADAFSLFFFLSLPWVALVIPFVPNSSFVNSNSLFPRMLWRLIVPWKKGYMNITEPFKNR